MFSKADVLKILDFFKISRATAFEKTMYGKSCSKTATCFTFLNSRFLYLEGTIAAILIKQQPFSKSWKVQGRISMTEIT